jgi:hypothetical protein
VFLFGCSLPCDLGTSEHASKRHLVDDSLDGRLGNMRLLLGTRVKIGSSNPEVSWLIRFGERNPSDCLDEGARLIGLIGLIGLMIGLTALVRGGRRNQRIRMVEGRGKSRSSNRS